MAAASNRLRKELESLAQLGDELLDASTIEYLGDFNRSGDVEPSEARADLKP
jgi:hypothetical protein